MQLYGVQYEDYGVIGNLLEAILFFLSVIKSSVVMQDKQLIY